MLNIIRTQRRATRIARKRIKECIKKGSTSLDLSNLDLKNDDLRTLFSPANLRNLGHLTSLNLSDNCLTSLPESIGTLTALESLNVSRNRLISLPESVGNLVILKKLYLAQNNLASLPESIGNLTLLEKLTATGNQLESLPESIGNLVALQKLYLSENQLSFLPDSMGNLATVLTEFSISDNPLDVSTQDFLQHTFGNRVEFNMASHGKSVDWRVNLGVFSERKARFL